MQTSRRLARLGFVAPLVAAAALTGAAVFTVSAAGCDDPGRLVPTQHGPVLVGGDMNTHGREGPWTAEARMSAAGYGHAKDSAVMYVFYPGDAGLVSHRQVRVASDHPAIVTTLDLSGAGDT